MNSKKEIFKELNNEKIKLVLNNEYIIVEQTTYGDILTLTKKGAKINRELEDVISDISEEDFQCCKKDYYRKISKYLNELIDKINITSFLYKDSVYSKFTFKVKIEKLIQLCNSYTSLSLLCELASNYLYLDVPTEDYSDAYNKLLEQKNLAENKIFHYHYLIDDSLTCNNSGKCLDENLVDEIKQYISKLIEIFINSLSVHTVRNCLLKWHIDRKGSEKGFKYKLINGCYIPFAITDKKGKEIASIK